MISIEIDGFHTKTDNVSGGHAGQARELLVSDLLALVEKPPGAVAGPGAGKAK